MLQEEEYGELQLYFKELADWTEDARNMIDTGNQLANAVLNVKMISAAEENIPVTINASLPDKMPVSDMEFVSLLGNLFDNALEASRKAATPYYKSLTSFFSWKKNSYQKTPILCQTIKIPFVALNNIPHNTHAHTMLFLILLVCLQSVFGI